jgi:hypothetical protein
MMTISHNNIQIWVQWNSNVSTFSSIERLSSVQNCARKPATTFFSKRKATRSQNELKKLFDQIAKAAPQKLDGQAGSDTGVDHRRRMCHDAATLQVAEAVHECTHGPLHTCGHGEGDEAQSWPQNSAVAGVAARAALEAQWHKWAAWWIGRSGCLSCDGVHIAEWIDQEFRIVSEKFTNGRCKEAGDFVGECSKLEVEMQRQLSCIVYTPPKLTSVVSSADT